MTGGHDHGEPLAGGTMNEVVRVGDRVLRVAGPWTPTIHRLLRHLHARGIAWVPRPLGMTGDGREVLSHLPGTVPRYPLPGWVWADPVLVDAGRRLATLHEALSDFDTAGASWQLPAHEPAEVVCHNDFAPYNLVFDEGRAIVGVIDWDVAAPGPRVRDLAYLAYRLVPLTRPQNPDGRDVDTTERGRRLRLLCGAYGPEAEPGDVLAACVGRLRELAEFTAARPAVAGHARLYRADADWLAASLA